MASSGLKKKVFLVSALPFILFFLSMVLFPLKENLTNYLGATYLAESMVVIEAASSVVHETQKERGQSAAYLNGGNIYEGLKKQRLVNQEKIDEFLKILKNSNFDPSYQESIVKNVSTLSTLRGQVDNKSISLSDALGGYTRVVKELLNIILFVADNTNLSSVATELKSLRILEDAKESEGKLRANMSAIFSKDTAIVDTKLSQILNLKSGIDQGLVSSGLVVDQKTEELIKSFKTSNQWQEVNQKFKLILKKMDEGRYGVNPVAFFGTITGALNIVGDVINHQKEKLRKESIVVKDQAYSNLIVYSSGTLVVLFLTLFIISKMSNSIAEKMYQIISKLHDSSRDVLNVSVEFLGSSKLVSETSTEQASALQETASSITEISNMIKKTSEATKESSGSSSVSKDTATKGKESIYEMANSIRGIAQSNDDIIVAMNENNVQMQKVTSVISNIAEKTEVINDIVFQTKLLSFNASVEAARAGENGKGFSVVAEEIGNLASMSGNAALEITSMLEESIVQVNEIVQKSKNQIELIISESKTRIENGTSVAENCSESLQNIIKNVTELDKSINEIAVASSEQSSGVEQVAKAMEQLDYLTVTNSDNAKKTSRLASSLETKAKDLDVLVDELTRIVDGRKTA